MKSLTCNAVFYGAAANLSKNCMDYSRAVQLICYGSSNRLIVYDVLDQRCIGTNSADVDGYVTCVRWTKGVVDSSSVQYIICCTASGSIQLFRLDSKRKNEHFNNLLTSCANWKGSDVAANVVDARFLTPDKRILIVATGADGSVRGWTITLDLAKSCIPEEIFCLKLPGRSLALDIQIIPIVFPSNDDFHLIAYGGDDGRIHFIAPTIGGSTYGHIGDLGGHEDWVLSLSHLIKENGDILLASGAKDGLIRLWSLSPHKQQRTEDNLLQVQNIELKIRRSASINDDFCIINCSLESAMKGHEGSISHLDWNNSDDESKSKTIQLLSCAKTEDRSVILWEAKEEDDEGLWIEKARFGEVGGNREGFFNAKFCDGGCAVVAVNYQGGFHKWTFLDGVWHQDSFLSGHADEVVDLDWDERGRFLMTVSKDQTTRVFACRDTEGQIRWQEIARPQVHGYALSCIARIDRNTFISGAEEKVLRGFSATAAFVTALGRFSTLSVEDDIQRCGLPEIASVPSLGLSNERVVVAAVDSNQNTKIESINDQQGAAPCEDKLLLGTLWLEISKLYGHGNEILSVASTSDGQLLASSCRATNELDAKIILWKTKEWKQTGSLALHRLSVTQMAFSPCDKFLLSVSRDRSWAVSRIEKDGSLSGSFHCGQLPKTQQHSRVIWACAWLPESLAFVTGSRDKTVSLWRPVNSNEASDATRWERRAIGNVGLEVTALAAVNLKQRGWGFEFLLAVGTVSGDIFLKVIDVLEGSFIDLLKIEPCHRKAVRRLKFSPSDNLKKITLATGGNDNAVIIYDIKENLTN